MRKSTYGALPINSQFQGAGEILVGAAKSGYFVALFNGITTTTEPSGYAFATSDAWAKWTSFAIGSPGSLANYSGLSQTGGVLWSVLEGDRTSVELRRFSGGWVSRYGSAPPGTIESLVARSSSKAFALTTDGLFVTTDSAAHWQRVSGPSTGT